MKIERLVKILKESNLHFKLLDPFQQNLISDRTYGYATFKSKVNITEDQEKALEEIAKQLYID